MKDKFHVVADKFHVTEDKFCVVEDKSKISILACSVYKTNGLASTMNPLDRIIITARRKLFRGKDANSK